jgi:hypothetical protein
MTVFYPDVSKPLRRCGYQCPYLSRGRPDSRFRLGFPARHSGTCQISGQSVFVALHSR